MEPSVDIAAIPLRFFNTESRVKEVFKPIQDKKVRMYTCGPTVYHYAHIGNFRTYIFEDLLRRTLKFFGNQVTQVMNLTDVDDKTIKGAIAKKVSLNEYTQPYKDAFFADLKALNIEPAEFYPAATDYIDDMIEMIRSLIDKGIAYKAGDGSIYYAIHKFPRYGCLSHLHMHELKEGASERVASDEYEKENVVDFVLWKSYDPERDGQIFWESPFGKGRPGWHLECSTMAIKILGPTLDIHVGGVDNMFPHHENEIAQSEAYSNKQFVKLWMHAEHLIVDGKKMSKSLGNFYTLRDLFQKGFTGPQIRYMLLQNHYKTQLNFTLPGLESVKQTLRRLEDFIDRMQSIQTAAGDSQKIQAILHKTLTTFATALADDLNISEALAALFEMVRQVNLLSDVGGVGVQEAQNVLQLLRRIDTVLGVLPLEKRAEVIPEDLQIALSKRQQARKDKDWKAADELRDLIIGRGYVIEDTPVGARLKKVE